MSVLSPTHKFRKTLRGPSAPRPAADSPPPARPAVPQEAAPSSHCEAVSWAEATADFLRQMHGGSEPNTQAYYRSQVGLLGRWAEGRGISVAAFRVRHLRDYIACRTEQGRTERTVRHDVVTARAFCRFCASERYMASDPLADYAVPRAAVGYRKSPSAPEVRALLAAVQGRWSPALAPGVVHVPQKTRTFLSRRNYAIIAGLVDTGCRVGEMLALNLSDYDAQGRCIHIRKSKGNRPRSVPVSPEWQRAVDAWLRVRPKALASPLLFVSRFGEGLNAGQYSEQFQQCRLFARAGYEAECRAKGVPADDAFLSHFTLHGLRHYAATTLTDRAGYEVARRMLGHASVQTTQQYVHSSADALRDGHAAASPLGSLLVNVRSEKARRKRLL